MEIKSITSKLVKPSKPTPSNLRKYDISFFDEQIPNINTPLILYYSTSPNDIHIPYNHFETSLSKTLTDFYPLAGRYMRQGSFVDCSDQGALYIQSISNFRLEEFLGQAWELKFKMLYDFLPCEVPEAGEIDDPLLYVKVTTLECGGVAIGMCFSHKVCDMCTMSTFINNWATRSREIVDELELEKYSPIFTVARDFPKVTLDDLSPRFPRSNVRMETRVRLFQFKVDAISKMRENLHICQDNTNRRPSKVQLVVALLSKAMMDIGKVSNGQSKASIIQQVVNLRNKVVPKLPENLFGNLVSLAHARIKPEEGENMDLQGFLMILNDSIKEIESDYAKALMSDDKEYEVLVKPFLTVLENFAINDAVNFYSLSSWCKFSFHKADFGWGKPVWRSTGQYAFQKSVILMDDEEGDGVEAWVHLDEKSMCQLQQDPEIKAYAG